MGISLAKYHHRAYSYEVETFNFNIYPSGYLDNHKYFTFQSSTIPFLARNNFDFNKCFVEGVEFLSQDKYLKYREIIDQFPQFPENIGDILSTRSVRTNFVKLKPQIQCWLEDKNSALLELPLEALDGDYVTGFFTKLVNVYNNKININIEKNKVILTKCDKNLLEDPETVKTLQKYVESKADFCFKNLHKKIENKVSNLSHAIIKIKPYEKKTEYMIRATIENFNGIVVELPGGYGISSRAERLTELKEKLTKLDVEVINARRFAGNYIEWTKKSLGGISALALLGLGVSAAMLFKKLGY
ncbi:Poly(A)-specific ribonuclease PARN [Thelohanellus kitauei]|uniref:Poly(A)-specific ribonuclease PARN n=1 Tax=Thelohanellus kitauei TaxID=669202 RepID=A0A0C2MY59_THEKT|nr:Poly(A)-specific ribonuclease PARN [Thelohanellus kitauei]